MITALKKIIENKKSFFYTYSIFLILGGFSLFIYTKEESFFIINRHYSFFADIFFKYATYFGDGLFFVFFVLILAFFSYQKSLLGVIIFLVSSLTTQLLKLVFFYDVMRPEAHFAKEVNIHFVEGVTRYTNNSFPSGHSTSIFALSLFVVLILNLQKTGWLLAILAICIGYSRVYLAVHFPVDVYFGSLIGTLSTLVIYAWLNKPLEDKFGNKSFLTRG